MERNNTDNNSLEKQSFFRYVVVNDGCETVNFEVAAEVLMELMEKEGVIQDNEEK